MNSAVRFEDFPDEPSIRAASRIWRDAESTRVGAAGAGRYLDEQQNGFVEAVGRPDAWISAAIENGVVVGCVAGFPAPDRTEERAMLLAFLVVDPASRRSGLGRLLVSHAEERTRSAGFDRLILTVHEDNAPARALYERCGWEPTGRTQRTPVANEVLLEYVRSVSQ